MATIDVKDAAGATVSVGKYLPGRAAAADSAPQALSTEDKAALDAMSAKLPASLGIKTAANSMSLAPASDALFPVIFSGAAPISISGTITTGGTAQNAAAANTTRRGFWIQNLSTGDLWISTIATAVASQPSLKIPAGALYEAPLGGSGTGAISVFGATTSQAFSGREW